ncbi:MAG: hypothetical protein ACR2RE_02280 [Geminicoccaceae bacterium]
MRSLSRRNALTGAILAVVAPSEAVAAPDPHVEWLEEWRALYVRYETEEASLGDPEGLYEQMWRIADCVHDTQATSARGLIAKLEFFRESNFRFADCYVDPESANAIVDEAIAFIRGI